MTLDETRQLGIEFERRIQTMIPETEIISKLDTETIYSYLNQYQDKFIHDIYKALDGIPTPSKPSAYVESILQGLLKIEDYAIDISDNHYTLELPDDFGLYLNSLTKVSDSYSYKSNDKNPGYIPNTLIAQSKADELMTRPQDSMRIMRQPIAYLSKQNEQAGLRTMEVFYDRYTNPQKCKLSYYKIPAYMNLFEKKPCELPMSAFDDLVTGAVDLYVQYVAGAEARKRQMNEQQQKRNSKDDEQ